MKLLLLLVVFSFSDFVYAKDINFHSMEKGGFGNVAEILRSMSPEQRKQVLVAAKEIERELKALPQSERNRIYKEMKSTASNIDYSKVKVDEIDPSKSGNLKGLMNELSKYKEKTSR